PGADDTLVHVGLRGGEALEGRAGQLAGVPGGSGGDLRIADVGAGPARQAQGQQASRQALSCRHVSLASTSGRPAVRIAPFAVPAHTADISSGAEMSARKPGGLSAFALPQPSQLLTVLCLVPSSRHGWRRNAPCLEVTCSIPADDRERGDGRTMLN